MRLFLLYLAQTVTIDPGNLNIPQEELPDNSSAVQNGLNIFLGIAAAVALLIIVISALRLVISRGNAQDVQKARDAIIYATIGLIVTMVAFAIVNFVLEGVSV